jgi:hypothetical protein
LGATGSASADGRRVRKQGISPITGRKLDLSQTYPLFFSAAKHCLLQTTQPASKKIVGIQTKRQFMTRDAERLRLLSLFHYVVGGIAALFACIPCFHLALGIAFVAGAINPAPGQEPPPAFFGWFFIVFASACVLFGWSLAVAVLVAGRFLARHTHYLYCLVVAGIECLFMPFGTILAFFTIAVLLQPSVKSLFDGRRPEVEANACITSNDRSAFGTLLFAGVGSLMGTLCFLQLGSCLGYYVGAIIHGFGRQPPVGYVVIGGGLFILPGCICGALAGLRLRRGLRPNLVFVLLIAFVNVAALLGTIDIAFDISFQSLTMRTIAVGSISGIMLGVIASLLLQRLRPELPTSDSL